jgi:hypothetical protein
MHKICGLFIICGSEICHFIFKIDLGFEKMQGLFMQPHNQFMSSVHIDESTSFGSKTQSAFFCCESGSGCLSAPGTFVLHGHVALEDLNVSSEPMVL